MSDSVTPIPAPEAACDDPSHKKGYLEALSNFVQMTFADLVCVMVLATMCWMALQGLEVKDPLYSVTLICIGFVCRGVVGSKVPDQSANGNGGPPK